MTVSYGQGFTPVAVPTMRAKVEALQVEVSKQPQYEPPTTHIFHGGMYCRQVAQAADALIIGKVHKREHFYMVVSGTVVITTDDGVQRITGPCLLSSMPGTKRAIYSETDALYMTLHRTDCTSVEDAEAEMVEEDPTAMFGIGNTLKTTNIEVEKWPLSQQP